MPYTIMTDSATDMPKEIVEKFDLHVIPTPVVIEETDYFDGSTILPEQFYDILRSGTDVKTYHINQYMFYENFKPYAEAGKEVVYFCFSTGIAGTYNAANLAKQELLEEFPEFDLTIVDSKCASIGFGLGVYYALLMQKNGASKEQVLEAARFHFDHMEHMITVSTLEYLYKGGRLSRTAALAGGLLDLKPIIEMTDDGALAAIEKIRGRKKALRRVVELVGERGAALNRQIIGIAHGDCIEEALEVKRMLEERYGCQNFKINYVGCAIGAHTGPGVIGVTFLDAESPYTAYLKE
ncbi:MAG: DegV family protein [Lachnospiraceae bacterium]|jgi:DegV family protein with EDD domain|nr:DegV family protein [Lachnospiraceae bacterium]MCX4315199.1 DegV family protein [Lachnospiraceae bacterium]